MILAISGWTRNKRHAPTIALTVYSGVHRTRASGIDSTDDWALITSEDNAYTPQHESSFHTRHCETSYAFDVPAFIVAEGGHSVAVGLVCRLLARGCAAGSGRERRARGICLDRRLWRSARN